ncbi:single-stranded DNA-binding protein [Subtercola sp. Z020]|uniref:single-stranded DNA-binding protein n=1 Tax=Subtercola sp. Z020 TaxID=2080582 RepID=UPI00130E87CF|nr:single-stranded DNA-binding protein [Subtercola sp. Z020]
MPEHISLTGVVATDPRNLTTTDGLAITSFRLASSQRRFDRHKNAWLETGTNWYTVTVFRQLAANVASSLAKGDRVVASGRLRVREWQNGEKTGMTVEVEADAVGHDLFWGTSTFARNPQPDTPKFGLPTQQAADEKHDADGFFPASHDESELVSHAPDLDSSRL